MTNWFRVARRALASGSSAGVVSLIALAAGGLRDCRSAFAPVNAVSHWIWRDRALRQQDASLRYTVPGYGIHHSMSILWALAYEERMARAPTRGPLRAIATGLAVSAAACFVDLKLTPERLTPGFERRLRPGPLAAVYIAFGLGLALPAVAQAMRRRRRGQAVVPASAEAAPAAASAAGSAGPDHLREIAAAAATMRNAPTATARSATGAASGAPDARPVPTAPDEDLRPWHRSTTSRPS